MEDHERCIIVFTHKRTNHAFFNSSIQGPIAARICWDTNEGETVSLSRDNDVTKYNVIMKNNESTPRFLAVGAVAINMR